MFSFCGGGGQWLSDKRMHTRSSTEPPCAVAQSGLGQRALSTQHSRNRDQVSQGVGTGKRLCKSRKQREFLVHLP